MSRKHTDLRSRALVGATVILATSLLLAGCLTDKVKRAAGQSELFFINPATQMLQRAQDYDEPLTKARERTQVAPQFGDRVRFASDTLLIQVESAYIADKPDTLTGSSDILLFAEVWENAGAGDSLNPMTYVICAKKDQLIPGKVNFKGSIAYGPTNFKGHQLKIKFTIMILQRSKGEQQGNVADVVSRYAGAVPVYGAFLTPAASVIRDVLRAQPDVVAFDFEAVLDSDKPEKLTSPIITTRTNAPGGGQLASEGTETVAKPAGEAVPWDRLSDSFGWLQYGQYAIVETAAREQGQAEEGDTSTTTASFRYDRRLESTRNVKQRGGWLIALDKGKPNLPHDLESTYLIFSIVPSQLAEDSATLEAASAAASRLMESLRQTDANVAAALATIDKTAKDLKYSVVESQASKLAERIAKSGDLTYDSFKARFAREFADLQKQFGTLPEDLTAADKKNIEGKINARFEGIYTSLGKGPSKDPAPTSVAAEKFTADATRFDQDVARLTKDLDKVKADTEALVQTQPEHIFPKEKSDVFAAAEAAFAAVLAKYSALNTAPATLDEAGRKEITDAIAAARAAGNSCLLQVGTTSNELLESNQKALTLGVALGQAAKLAETAQTEADGLGTAADNTAKAAAAASATAKTAEELDKVRVMAADAATFRTQADKAKAAIAPLAARIDPLKGAIADLVRQPDPANAELARLIGLRDRAIKLQEGATATEGKLPSANP
jgi:hypothetical protein